MMCLKSSIYPSPTQDHLPSITNPAPTHVRRQAGQLPVGDPLGHGHEGHGQAGQGVPHQQGGRVARQPGQQRDTARDGEGARETGGGRLNGGVG